MATGLRPASSNFVRILPMTPACRASGFRMLRVRSTAMSAPVRGGAFSRLEPQGQGAEQQLDVVVGEVEAPADEEVLSAHDASRRLVVQLPPIGDVVGARRDEQMIEEPVVGVDLDPGMLLERVGELEDVPREDQRVVQQVQFHPEAAGVKLHLLNDSLILSGDIFEFANPLKQHPRIKVYADYRFLDHLFITAGADDIANRRELDNETPTRVVSGKDFFVGGGFYFTDDDIKLLLSALPLRF